MFDERWQVARNADGSFAPFGDDDRGAGRGNGDREVRGSPRSWNLLIRQSESPARALAVWDALAAAALDGNIPAQKLYWERLAGRVESAEEVAEGDAGDWMEAEMMKADNARLVAEITDLRRELDDLRSAIGGSTFPDDSHS